MDTRFIVVALAFVVIGLLAGALIITTQQGATTSSESSTTSTLVTGESYVNSTQNLQLRLSVNASSTGGSAGNVTVQIRADEYNALAAANNVSMATKWGLNGLSLGSCGNGAYPFGVALYSGAYTAGNASEGSPLQIYPITPCPMLLRLVTAYLFQPTSDLAVVLPSGPNATATPMSANVTATTEYRSGASLSSMPLAPGTYTVAAGDEWGSVVVIQLSIGVGGASSTTSATGASTGTLDASLAIGPTEPVCRANATIVPAPEPYSSIDLVVNSSSGQITTLPVSWVSNGCEVSGVVQASFAPDSYSLNLSSCTFLGCTSALPKSFVIVAGQSTSIDVSIGTGIR